MPTIERSWDGKPYYDNDVDSKYKPEYCEVLMDWFAQESKRLYEIVELKDGTFDKAPPDPPTIERFTRDVSRPKWKVMRTTLYTWQRSHPEWLEAIEFAMTCYTAWLDRLTCAGAIPAGWAALAAKNRLGWVDKTDITSKGEKLPGGAQVAISGGGTMVIASDDMAQSLASTMARLGLTAPEAEETQVEVSQNTGKTLPDSDTNAVSDEKAPMAADGEEF